MPDNNKCSTCPAKETCDELDLCLMMSLAESTAHEILSELLEDHPGQVTDFVDLTRVQKLH